MFGIIFYSCCKLDYLSYCLETYYKCLILVVDVHALLRDVTKLFYPLYDKYAKFYGPSFNINFEQSEALLTRTQTNWIGKCYQLLFQRTKKSRGS